MPKFKKGDIVQMYLAPIGGYFAERQGGPLTVISHVGTNVKTSDGETHWEDHLTFHDKHWNQPHIIQRTIDEHRKDIRILQRQLKTAKRRRK